MDRLQLGHSIGALYGTALDVDGYLRRFIDINYRLPDPPKDLFPAYLFNQFKIPDLLKQLNPQISSSSSTHRLTIEWFSGLNEIFDLSLRTQEQIFSALSLMMAIGVKEDAEACHFLAAFLAIKVHREDLYANLIAGHITAETFLNYLRSKPYGEKFLNTEAGTELEAWFLIIFRDVFRDTTAMDIANKYKEMSAINNESDPQIRRADTICYMLRTWTIAPPRFARIIKRIAISGRLRELPA